MDELVKQELLQYDESSIEFLQAIFSAEPYILSKDETGYIEMLKEKKKIGSKFFLEKCEYCGSNNLVYINSEAAIVCTDCATDQKHGGNSSEVLRANSRYTGTNYIDSPHYYERKSHFIHIINELTGRCRTHIPKQVFDVVLEGELTLQGARASLRKAKLSSYICSVPRILEELSPHNCVSITYNEREALLADFKHVSWTWELIKAKVAPKRKSFLTYTFVIRKLCKRHKLDFLCRDLKRVKSVQTNALLEKYWKAVEKQLEWDKLCN
jgi:ribosomal protein S27E